MKINNPSKFELSGLVDLHKRLSILTDKNGPIGQIKKIWIDLFGFTFKKGLGKGKAEVSFSRILPTSIKENFLLVNLLDKQRESGLKRELVNFIFKFKEIAFNFEEYSSLLKKDLAVYVDQIHPEALVLYLICKGKGIDVGCGYRKTHPDAIGIDWIKKGAKGKVGNVKGKISVADVWARGDKLNMFKSNSLDYVISRHNLEHYQNPQKTLKEWIRVLKREGFLGVVVPNSYNPQTFEKTHYFDFDLNNLVDMFKETNQLKILKYGECIPKWSFYCIARKI